MLLDQAGTGAPKDRPPHDEHEHRAGRESGARVTTRAVVVFGFPRGKVAYLDFFRTKEKALDAVGLSG